MTSPNFLARTRAIGEVVLAIVAMFAVGALVGSVIAPLLPEYLRMPAQAMALWGGVIAGALMLRASKSSYRAIGFTRPASWAKTAMWVVIAIVVAQAGASAIHAGLAHFTDWAPLDVAYIRNALEGDTAAYIAWIVLVVWGSAAFGEELFARGFAFDRFQIAFGRGRVGVILAALAQAAVFGLLHAVQGPSGIIVTAYVGLVFAWVYLASGRNLWAPIIAHGLVDTFALTMLYLGIPLPGLG